MVRLGNSSRGSRQSRHPSPPETTTGGASTLVSSSSGEEDRGVHANDADDERPAIEMTVATSQQHSGDPVSMEQVADTTRRALYRFFYPSEGKKLKKGVRVSRDEDDEETPAPHSSHDDHDDMAEEAMRDFSNGDSSSSSNSHRTPHPISGDNNNNAPAGVFAKRARQDDEDKAFIHKFWTTYDDILILSVFTQVGIVFRLASASWFHYFDGVFSNDSPLFENLPLNCLSCFVLGAFCSGERLLEIIHTRFSPPRTQQSMVPLLNTSINGGNGHDDEDGDEVEDDDDQVIMPISSEEEMSDNFHRSRRGNHHHSLPSLPTTRRRRPHHLRRRKKQKQHQEHFVSWQPPVHLNEELRDVQLLALERRIRQSKCLLLFPLKKEDVDVMEHYFHEGYKKENHQRHLSDDSFGMDTSEGFDLALREESGRGARNSMEQILKETERREEASPPRGVLSEQPQSATLNRNSSATLQSNLSPSTPQRDPLAGSLRRGQPELLPNDPSHSHDDDDTHDDEIITEANPDILLEFTTNVQEKVQTNLNQLRRVNLADGWDTGTSAEEMSDDLMLGLRDGFCGALSSFSSWNSAMVALARDGEVGQALVGYTIGLQLPLVAYRFGQHVAVYVFIWRTRREARKDERRGYGIRVAIDEDESEQYPKNDGGDDEDEDEEQEKPSVRAIVTAIFIMALVTQITSIFFFNDPNNQQIALSLLFSPFGVLARWRLSKLNKWRPTFPIGTLTCNLLACALSGSLGTLLAGSPRPAERIVLVSFIAGFGGTLSSLATFIVEILAGVDPILLRFDGVFYAIVSIGAAFVFGLIFTASVEWADQVGSARAGNNDLVELDDDGLAGNTNHTSFLY